MSDPLPLYRLIHDATRVVSFALAVGRSYPPAGQTVFNGTQADCEARITALGLTPLPDPAVVAAAAAAKAAAQKTFDAAVAAGYAVPGVTPPLVLDMGDPARNLFHQLSYQLGLMKAAGRIADTDPITITDKSGAPRSFSVANVQTMILGLGETYLGLFAALHATVS